MLADFWVVCSPPFIFNFKNGPRVNLCRKMKARAPPPPPPAAPRPAPRRNFPPTLPLSQEDGDRSSGDQKENVLRDSLDVLLTLPGGIQKRTTVSGSKALMDLLVELCSQYHLSPVHHTLELQTRDAQPLAFKPNTLLGMLDVHTVLIKERVAEEKPKRPPPKLPEKTVRLVVNYHKTQKAVVRVSPVVPLNNLIPIICDKCEFDPRHIVLLSDSSSSKGLDLSKSLSDLGIRELYVLDHSLVLRSKIHSAPILNFSDPSRTSSVSTSVSDKKSLLGFFKLRRKSKTEEPRPMEMDAFDDSRYAPTTGADGEGNYTAPNTPGINSRECTIAACHSMGNISRLSPKSERKKRRAPPPPPPGSASMQNFQSVSLDDIQIIHDSPNINQQKKRRAPPPPPPPAPGSSGPTEETLLDRSRLMEAVESPCSDKEVPPESSPTQGGEESLGVKRELTEEDAKCEANNKTAEEAENKRHSTMDWQGTQQEGCSDQKSEEEEEDEEEVPKGSPHTSDNTSITSDHAVSHLSFTHHACQEAASEDCAPEEKGSTGWCSPNRWSGGQHPEDNDVDHCGDLGLTAQLRQTLADLEADLAAREEVDGVSEASAFPTEVSYSEAEAAVPVTAIDEVCDEDVNCVSDEVGTSQTERMSHVGDYPRPVHVDISSRELCVSSNINGNHSQSYMQCDTEVEPIREAPPAKQEEPREASTIKKEGRDDDPADEMKTNANDQRVPKAEKPPVATEGVQPALVSSRRQLSQMLKSPDFAARVGMKTFTVVPPKPVIKPYREREAPTVSGAIKIDDQGNLILPETANHKPTKSTGAGGSANGSLLRKAKAFWSSAEQELNVEEHKMGAAEPKTCNSQTSVTSGTPAPPRDETTQSREFKEELVKPTWDAGKRNTSMYERPIKPPQTLLLLSDNEIQAEFPFRKPIRRTSSQYIASAIAKCSKVPQSVSEPVQFQAKNVLGSVPEKGKHVSHSPHLENGERNGRLESERHKGPLDELSEKQQLGIPVSIIDQWTPQPAGNPEINNATSSFKERVYEGTWKNIQENSKSENVTGVNTDSDLAECHRSPLQSPTSYPKLSPPPQSRLGPSTSLENMQSNGLRAEAAHDLRPTGQSSYLTGPIAKSAMKSGSLFGPVKKFRPIHLKPLQKEASLHSSLMEAIQAGEGKERLRKTPDPIKSADHQKPSFVEAEDQRSQLLAAIRAQNGISGLRKISSTASTEISHVKNLENVQNATNGHSPSSPPAEFSHSKEKQVDAIHADAGSTHLKKITSESLQEHSPLATEGDFPVASCPPPPPPLPNQHSKLSQPRLPSSACANSGAREALMEAIRTGAGAAQLKKVPVPSKTILINGRLGTMQASSGS